VLVVDDGHAGDEVGTPSDELGSLGHGKSPVNVEWLGMVVPRWL
jgi:hypothetical protein